MRKRGVPSCSFLRAFQWNSSAIFAHTFAGFDEHRHAKKRLHIVKKRAKTRGIWEISLIVLEVIFLQKREFPRFQRTFQNLPLMLQNMRFITLPPQGTAHCLRLLSPFYALLSRFQRDPLQTGRETIGQSRCKTGLRFISAVRANGIKLLFGWLFFLTCFSSLFLFFRFFLAALL